MIGSYEDETMEAGEATETEESTEGEAEAPSESIEADSASEETVEEAPAPEAVAEEAPAEPEYRLPEFDFGSWDGQAEGLPEPYRPIHENVSTHLRQEIDGLRNSLEQDRELYQALLEGEDIGKDFQQKLAQAQAEMEKHEKAKSEWETQKADYDSRIEKYESKMAEVRQAEEQQAHQWAQEFRKEHAEVLDQDDKKDQFVKFLDSGIDAEIAIEFVRSGSENLVHNTLGYIAQGVPASYALRMAKADTGLSETQAAKPRAAAEMTAGASSAANMPESAEKSVSDKAFNIHDARRVAVERAFKRRTG
jgi:hypothetical protein